MLVQHLVNKKVVKSRSTTWDIPHVVYIKYYVATTCGGCPRMHPNGRAIFLLGVCDRGAARGGSSQFSHIKMENTKTATEAKEMKEKLLCCASYPSSGPSS